MQPPGDIIGMKDMEAVFSVTDSFGINRESVSVPLEKADPGNVREVRRGVLEITVPLTQPLEGFLELLQQRLTELGYEMEDA